MSHFDPSSDPRTQHAYCPFYCEENVWQLLGELGPARSSVVVMTNRSAQVALWHQRAAPAPDHPVVWDYHVILVREFDAALRVFDLDSTLPWGVDLEAYLAGSFANVELRWLQHAPRFRVCSGEIYRHCFASDRSHMRDAQRGWLQPPPPWPEILPPGQRSNLHRWVNLNDVFVGERCTFHELPAVLRRQCT